MDDRNLMENLLLLEKGACGLYLHGSLEASTATVHQAFQSALEDSLKLQDSLYTQMANKGWYAPEQAEQTKVDTVKQKFSRQ